MTKHLLTNPVSTLSGPLAINTISLDYRRYLQINLKRRKVLAELIKKYRSRYITIIINGIKLSTTAVEWILRGKWSTTCSERACTNRFIIPIRGIGPYSHYMAKPISAETWREMLLTGSTFKARGTLEVVKYKTQAFLIF